MRSCAADFELVRPNSLDGALDHLSRGYRPLAGGTDLMVLFNAGKLKPLPLTAIGRLAELRGISVQSDFIEIGAAVRYSEVRQHALVSSEFSLLAQAASWTGGIANQNRGTLGGNIANASPAADSSPVLLVYDAELKLVSKAGERRLPYSEFHLGYKALALRPDELIASIRLPRPQGPIRQYGRKVGTRKAMAISKVSLAAIAVDGAFRIAAGSVGPVPLRCWKTERFLHGLRITPAVITKAKRVMQEDIAPIDDIRSTAKYRLMVAQNLLGEFLEALL